MITDKDLNYDDLASGLKAALENDKSVFDADQLQKYTGTDTILSFMWFFCSLLVWLMVLSSANELNILLF